MKVTLSEHSGCFAIELEAETMAEAAKLTRFGMDSTGELRSSSAFANSDGTFSAYVVIGKSKRANHTIVKRSRR